MIVPGPAGLTGGPGDSGSSGGSGGVGRLGGVAGGGGIGGLGGVARFGNRTFDFATETAVLAIINRTPDSFYDRGSTFALDGALDAVHRAVAAGADWIDVGGVPFGPGPEVTVAQEIDRVLPVLQAARDLNVVVSVDTTRSEVAAAALAAGADVINDTSGLRDPEMAATIAAHDAGLILVHSAAPPRVRVVAPQYDDVVAQVHQFLADRLAVALAAGVRPDGIVVDPGHDLHKNTYHSLELTQRLVEFTTLGPPLLVAVSNKDFIGETLNAGVSDRVAGSIAVAIICLLRGARLFRVHNVAETVQAVRTAAVVLGWQEPGTVRHNID